MSSVSRRNVAFAVIATVALTGAMVGPASNAATAISTSGHPGQAITPAENVPWRQFHGSPSHRGVNKRESRVGPENVSSLSLSWIGNGAQSDEDLVSESSPVVVNGFVYFGTIRGQLLAFADTCKGSLCDPVWRVDLQETITDTPAYADGILYVGTSSRLGALYAFDTRQCARHGGCQPLWSAKVEDNGSSPTVANGVVYVGSYDTGLYAFDADGCGKAHCQPLWVGHTDGTVTQSPAVSHGRVFVGDGAGSLYAFDADGCGMPSCTALWTGDVGAPAFSSPAVKHGVVYVGSFASFPDARLQAFNARGCGKKTCDPLWGGTGGHYFSSSPAIAYGTVYIGSGDGVLLAYPASGCGHSTCAPAWQGSAAGAVATMASPPMIANGVVYVGKNNSVVYAFAAHGCGEFSCEELWSFITQDPLVDSSPVMVNGTLYVSGTNFGSVPELYVFEPFGG